MLKLWNDDKINKDVGYWMLVAGYWMLEKQE
jgi:hypothetical protein